MKKLVFTTIAIACFSAMTFAQAPATAPSKAEMTKEEKKAMKAKQESDLQEALKGAELTAEQAQSATEIIAAAGKKSKELKDNDKLTAEEKETAKKTINEEKNAKLKELMGADKYKAYTSIRKKQKEAMEAAKTPQ